MQLMCKDEEACESTQYKKLGMLGPCNVVAFWICCDPSIIRFLIRALGKVGKVLDRGCR